MAAQTIRALAFKAPGRPKDVLRLVRAPQAPLPETGLRLKMVASAINPADVNQIEGVYPTKQRTFPFGMIGGQEALGQIVQVGARAVDPDTGDRPAVGEWAIAAQSGEIPAWVSQVVCDNVGQVIRLGRRDRDAAAELLNGGNRPGHLSPLAAATLRINPCTAYLMLRGITTLPSGSLVVQNGANSMVGQLVIQMARHWGLKTANVVRARETPAETARLTEQLRLLGANLVVTPEQLEERQTAEEIRALGGGDGGARLAFNCVGGRSATLLTRFLAPGGRLVTYGAMAREPVVLSASSLIFRDITAQGFWVSRWMREHSRAELSALIHEIAAMYEAGVLAVPPVRVVRIPDNLEDSEAEQRLLAAVQSPEKTVIAWA